MSKDTSPKSSNRRHILSVLQTLQGKTVDAGKFIANMAKEAGTDADTVKRVLREQRGQVTIDAEGNLTVVKDAMLLNTTSRKRSERSALFGIFSVHDRSRHGRGRKR